MCEISKHPYEPYIPEGADRLIVGTIPPYRFCRGGKDSLLEKDVDFYYGSKDNRFWDLLSDAVGKDLVCTDPAAAADERRRLLADIHTGITDIIDTCVHAEMRSDDASLRDIRQKDIAALLRQNPGIRELIYTSRFVIRQVNLSVKEFCGTAAHHRWSSGNRLDGSVRINGTAYVVRILYSPSPNALRSISREKRAARYKEVFGN